MSDDLHKYPGNLKHHKVDEATATHLRIIANQAELIQRLVDDVVELQAQYAKDTGREKSIGNEALKAAIAQGFKL